MFENNWRTFSDIDISNLFETLDKIILDLFKIGFNRSKMKFIVACDSHVHKTHITYCTSIVFVKEGKGGNIFNKKEIVEFENKPVNLSNTEYNKWVKQLARERLWNECMKSVECAKTLDKFLAQYGLKVSEIHSDVNVNKKYLSYDLLSAINGYVTGSQYISVVKPQSWAATNIADYKTK